VDRDASLRMAEASRAMKGGGEGGRREGEGERVRARRKAADQRRHARPVGVLDVATPPRLLSMHAVDSHPAEKRTIQCRY